MRTVPFFSGIKPSIRQKLLAAFAVDLILLVALGAFAWHQMGTMNQRASHVEERVIPTLRNIQQIDDSLARYRTLQLEYMIYTNPADKARLVQEMEVVEAAMEHHLETQAGLLEDLPLGGASSGSHQRLTAAWQGFVEANHQRFLPALEVSNTGSVQPGFSRLNPLYEDLILAARQVAEESEGHASAALGDVRTTYDTSRYFILADTLISVALSALVGLLLSANLARRIRRLTLATREVAKGDLDRQVKATGSDELALLASGFNHMVGRLRDKRSALEERNEALLSSLDRQRQLTEDLVARKAAEEEAVHAKSVAEAANQAKSYFLATMSHELRTPLNAILGYAQILHLERSVRPEADAMPELDRILAAGKHLSSLINNILDYSKIEQGRASLVLGNVPVEELLGEVMGIVESLAKEGQNSLRLDVKGDLGVMHSDAGKMRQVLFNLLSNATKFTRQGEIALRAEAVASIDPCSGAAHERLRFQVIDTGIGIAEHELERIFEPFRQAEDSTTRRFDGTGLGLVVSRQLCRLLGGDVTVESAVGLGSTFLVDLPRVTASQSGDEMGLLLVS